MKIALVGLTHPFRGGISHYTTLLCRELMRRHEVRLFALSRQYPRLLFPGTTQRDESAVPLQVPNEPCLDSIQPLSWWRTARRIREFGPRLVLFSWWHPFFAPAFGTVARLSGRRGGPPSCFVCHNVMPHESTALDRLLLRYAYGAAAGFITHSHEDAERLRSLRPEVPVLDNPHPTYASFADEDSPSTDEAKAGLGLSGRRVLLFFGYVRRYKGLDVLLEAMRELAPEAGYHLLVVGEFYEERSKYAAALDELRKRGQLTLVDRYVPNEEIPRYFAAADLVLVPYLTATQSGIVQLAYGFGKPVVATTAGGLPDVVSDGETGFLVPPADPAALAVAVRRFFDEDEADRFRRRIAAESDRFSWDRMVETIERIADEIA